MIRTYGKFMFITTAAAVVAVFIYVSAGLVKDLSTQERQRMEIWADATREIVASVDSESGVDIDFLSRIIESNTTIPVLLTDDSGRILGSRNIPLPDDPEQTNLILENKLKKLAQSTNVIEIVIAPGMSQYLYYEDSTLLKRLSYYPYVVLVVMIAFVVVVYFAMLTTKRAEQNKVWVGLSKETAHQLGTPISSLMAWMELLPEMGVDQTTVDEMNKDVNRLSTIASRFSKIGSVPQMECTDLNATVANAAGYMSTRISKRIALSFTPCSDPLPVKISAPLFEWVMENLIKNAVDAMDGAGSIDITTGKENHIGWVEIADTGKGIPRKNFNTVFNPGYTTKKRGWGLGLTLARRIIRQYHRGTIYVKSSTIGVGTTFRITLPLETSQR